MTQPHLCSNQQLAAMLNSDSEAEQFPELLQHVEQCSRCQQYLETLAADAQDWRQAAQVLSDFSSSDDFRSHTAASACPRRAGDWPSEWTEAMARQLLAPGSHPELLGRIGRYDVERLIGSGGMGIVFKAFDTELNRPVAIKILAPYLSGSGPARQRFAREAKAAAAVVHEHVVPIHNVETDGQSPYLVMRYVSGESLQARIDRYGALTVCEILRIAMQTASGLAAAHSHGLIHRDIKPSNILVESTIERSLITDFGLARAADDASLTNTGYHPGTPQFMSPEQARGDSLDPRSDLFSLGSVMYTMATSRPPFRAETSYGILRRITDSHPRDIQEINPEIPSWLCGVIGKLMEKSPNDRFHSAEELSELLSLCLAHVQRPASCPLPTEVLELDARGRGKFLSQRLRQFGIWLAAIVVIAISIALATPWLSKLAYRKNSLANREHSKSLPQIEGNSEPAAQNSNNATISREATVRPPVIRGPKKLGPPEPSEVVRQKLTTPTTVTLDAVNLQDGVAEILKASHVDFTVNEASLKNADIDLTQTKSLSGSGTTFVMLKRFLDRFHASFIVHDADLEIVAAEYAQQHPVLRYYELSLIQPGNQSLPEIVVAIEQCGQADLWSSVGGGPFTLSHVDSMLLVKADESTHYQIQQLLSQFNAIRRR